jgi:hypothetical protein
MSHRRMNTEAAFTLILPCQVTLAHLQFRFHRSSAQPNLVSWTRSVSQLCSGDPNFISYRVSLYYGRVIHKPPNPWTIISHCALTLFACLSSAICPNIPSPKDSSILILWQQLESMVTALDIPELIVTWAMCQSFSARHATRRFNDSIFNITGK